MEKVDALVRNLQYAFLLLSFFNNFLQILINASKTKASWTEWAYQKVCVFLSFHIII